MLSVDVLIILDCIMLIIIFTKAIEKLFTINILALKYYIMEVNKI